jgi:hypothetical protein
MTRFYPSKVYGGTAQFPYYPELITDRVMLNPIYKVRSFANKPLAICDSGAFQDIDKHTRLTPQQALDRQLKYEIKIQEQLGIDWRFEAFCIYDQMIGVDECIIDGKKVKKRGTSESAEAAVIDTIMSADYYKSKEDDLSKIVYIAQGVNADQYVRCTQEVLQYARPTDYFGFGGFCIIGRQRKIMLPIFYETVYKVLPVLYSKNIKRAHLLGVCLPEAITFIISEAKKYNIEVSTDSSAPEVNAVIFGKTYSKEGRISKKVEGVKWLDYNPIHLAESNVRKYNNWIQSI